MDDIWDEKHIKALLRLHRHPVRLIQVDPWHTWLEERGGAKQVIEHLRSGLLASDVRQLLDVLLANPNASTYFYAKKLNIGHSSYFVQLKNLIQVLMIQLNREQIAAPFDQRSSAVTNLPTPLTSLIGARKSVDTVAALLKRSDVRLLTLTGPGGVGKTRLAIAAGWELLENFGDGVFFVPLETINNIDLLIIQIARLLNLETVGQQSLLDVIKTYLRKQQVLLILDNFEQLVQCADVVAELLEASMNLKVLVTSREMLNIYGEARYIVPQLLWPDPNHPPPLEQLSQWPALDLFVQRVQTRHPEFSPNEINLPAIAQICYRLEGLPLAIELAAAQVRLLSSEPQLEYGLKTLRDLSRNRPVRQKTLWNAIDWSYQLLSDVEKALFRRLAVFGHEWGMDAARVVCQTDDAPAYLERLADKSLVSDAPIDVDGRPRFQMLQAVREYALEQLAASAETGQTQRLHASYYLSMVLQAEPFIGTSDQLHWMHRIRQERENLQIALQWMLDAGETDMADSLLGAVWRFYSMLNILSETRLWMDRALAQGTHPQTLGRVKALWGAYWLAAYQRDYSKALQLAQEGLRLAQEMGDQRLTGLLLQCMADHFVNHQQYEQALKIFEESLHIFRTLNDQEETAWVLAHLGDLFFRCGDVTQSLERLQESLTLFRAIGHDWAVAHILRNMAVSLEQKNDIEQAKVVIQESVRIFKQVGNLMGMGWTINFQGQLVFRQSDFDTALRLFQEAQAIFEQLGDQPSLASNHEWIEKVQNQTGR